MAFGWFSKTVPEVYPGKQFVFIGAEKKPLQISVNGQEQKTAKGRVCMSRYGPRELGVPVDAKGVKRDFKLSPAAPPSQMAVVTDRLVYAPGEAVRLAAVVCPPRPGLRLVVQREGAVAVEQPLPSGSLLFHTCADLEVGSYQVFLLGAEGPLALARFAVCAPRVAVLRVELLAYELDERGDALSYRLRVTQFDEPLAGPVQVALSCNGSVLQSADGVANAEGVVEGSWGSLHEGPFRISVRTPEGNSASVPLPGTAPAQRIPLCLGSGLRLGGAPFQGAQPVDGIYLRQDAPSEAPISVLATQGEVRVRDPQQPARVVAVDLLSGVSQEIEPKEAGVRVPVNGPAALVLAAAWPEGQLPYETYGVVMSAPLLELECPAQAEPGGELEVRLRAHESGQCLLIVRDARVECEELSHKLSEGLLEHLSRVVKPLGEGSVSLYDPAAPLSEAGSSLPPPHPVPPSGGPSARTPAGPPPPPLGGGGPQEILSEGTTHWETFALSGDTVRRIPLGANRVSLRISAYLVTDRHAAGVCREVQVSRSAYVEIDAPASMSAGERVGARVRYALPETGELVLSSGRHPVSGRGVLGLTLDGPGPVSAELTSASVRDRVEVQVPPTGRRREKVSRILRLQAGQEASGASVVVFPTSAHLVADLTASLLKDPFACAEQMASQLQAMAILLRACEQGHLCADDGKRLNGQIQQVLTHLAQLHHPQGGFSLWKERMAAGPDIRLSGQVLRGLLPFRRLPFPAAHEMIQPTTERLLQSQYKDNRLFAYDRRFGAGLTSNEDAAALYVAGVQKEAALLHLRQSVQKMEEGTAYWKASPGWGTDLGVTCDVARIMLELGDPLFAPAFAYVTRRLPEGRLSCPADSRALIQLVAQLPRTLSPQAEIDGATVELSQGEARGKSVRALSDGLIVRVEDELELDDLQAGANFKGTVVASAQQRGRGQRLTLSVTPEEPSRCPLVRVFLPGCLTLEGGASGQSAHLPIEGTTLELSAVAIREGAGWIQVVLRDLYNPAKTGCLPPVSIQVD